jgi:hypothetical protein
MMLKKSDKRPKSRDGTGKEKQRLQCNLKRLFHLICEGRQSVMHTETVCHLLSSPSLIAYLLKCKSVAITHIISLQNIVDDSKARIEEFEDRIREYEMRMRDYEMRNLEYDMRIRHYEATIRTLREPER